jgi:mono/diheme cytochrome c family protein
LLLCAGVLLAGSAFAEPSPEGLFIANCSACHQRNGRGIPQAFPALAGDSLVQGDPQGVVVVLLNGRGGMPAFKAQLDDGQIAAVATYVRGAWGNHADPISAALVAQARTDAAPDTPAAERNLQAH